MKKIIFALAAVAALAACTKTEYVDVQNEISLAPVTRNITKAMVDDNIFPVESFNVWAWYKQLPADTPIAAWQASTINNQPYIIESTFRKKDNQTDWSGVTPYYWPKLGSLLFAGYYPASISDDVSYEFGADVNKMIFTGINQSVVTTNTTHEEDIMYFNMTTNSVASGPVSVVFNHALSWITMNVKKSTGSPMIVIDEIKFTKVKNTGTGTVDNSATTAAGKVISWETTGNPDAETVFGEDVELDTNPTKLVEPLFIPQTMSGQLVISYTVYSSDDEKFNEVYTADLNSLKSGLNKWEPAKHYTYDIEIGTTEILITPSVKPWEAVSVPVEGLNNQAQNNQQAPDNTQQAPDNNNQSDNN